MAMLRFGRILGRIGFAIGAVVVLSANAQPTRSIDRDRTEAEQRTLASLEPLHSHPLYQLTFYGDYARTAPIRVSQSSAEIRWGCSLFAAMGDGRRPLYGRNFDWKASPAVILFADPSDGYATVTMVDVSYLGFTPDDPKFRTIEGREGLLQAPLIPFDGMNEKGLVVGMAAIENAELPHDPEKPTIGSLRIIRMVLDQCATVDEALQQFEQYNLDFNGGPQIHYLIADADGHSALIEHSAGQMRVIRNQQNWQAATNFHFFGNEKRAPGLCARYHAIRQRLIENQGRLDIEQSMDLLANVAQSNTRWSVVYDLKQLQIHLAMSREFTSPIRLELEESKPQSRPGPPEMSARGDDEVKATQGRVPGG